ncbi:hypothetical protein ElyMa_003992600, partial [Elysia marginata]
QSVSLTEIHALLDRMQEMTTQGNRTEHRSIWVVVDSSRSIWVVVNSSRSIWVVVDSSRSICDCKYKEKM